MSSVWNAGPRARAWGVTALLALVVCACTSRGGSSPTAPGGDTDFGANDPSVVVALGDSITFGKHDVGVDTCDDDERSVGGFCPPLSRLTGKIVVNEGECGDDSFGGEERVQGVLRRWRPGVLLIDYSPNDIVNGTSALTRNLRAIVAAARSNHTVPILGTLVPAVGDHEGWEPFIVNANASIRALCQELGVECADHYQAFVSNPEYRSSPYALLDPDGLHPNTAGYAVMAKTWRWPVLRAY